jgi:hypothetical protein
VRNRMTLPAAMGAGIIAGAVFIILEMTMVPSFAGGSPWGPPRMIAAIVAGKTVLPTIGTQATFNLGIFIVAMLVHFILSAIFALILAGSVTGRSVGVGALVGGAFGILLYLINFYVFTALFPWFAMARTWITVFTHVVFGIVAAVTYLAMIGRGTRVPRETARTEMPAL